MTDHPVETLSRNSRGAITRLFGVILVMLGSLNTMLAWRGSFEVHLFPTALIVIGLLFVFIGAVRRQSGS